MPTKKTEKKESKMKIFQSTKFLTNLFLGLTAAIFLFMAYYTYTNLTKYFDMRSEITLNETLHGSLAETDTRVLNELNKVNEENSVLKKQIYDEINLVLPGSENHTYLTRTLEKFESDNNRLRDPFNISNLKYGNKTKQKKGDTSPFVKLPFSMNINCSYNNFFKFLAFVQNSGTLSEGSRLMDIETISINFTKARGAEGNTSGQDEINFNIKMNAYIRL